MSFDMFPSTDSILLGVVIAFSLLLFVVIYQLWRMERKFLKLMAGKNGKSLEDVITLMRQELLDGRRSMYAVNEHIDNLEHRVQTGIRKVEMVRFNPFKDAGGDQSFSIAFLDEKHKGVVISSLYSREGVRVYAKPVHNGESTYTLSDEEKHVIKKAI
jgi:hypothetical protein